MQVRAESVSYGALLTRMFDENRLFSALLELTHDCDLNCFFCYNDRTRKGIALSFEQYVHLLHDLKELGTWELTLSGGEPLLHPHFFDLGGLARRLGFVVRVKSNGMAMQETLARKLLDQVDPFMIEISLHGASSGTHDRQTGVAGSFDRLLDNLHSMQKLGMRVQLNVTLTAWNEAELEDMLGLAESLAMRIQIDTRITPRDDGSRKPLQISPSRHAVEKLLGIQQQRAEAFRSRLQGAEVGPPDPVDLAPARRKYCGAGSLGVAVDPWGNVYPCVQWRMPAGNLHHQSIRDIWDGSVALQAIRATLVNVAAEIGVQAEHPQASKFCPGLELQGDRCSAVEESLLICHGFHTNQQTGFEKIRSAGEKS
jgi:mycofactocin biosynthetic radical S-adenosylmethionine protein MftC